MTSLNHPVGETVHSLVQRESFQRLCQQSLRPVNTEKEAREHLPSESLGQCHVYQKASDPLLKGHCCFPTVICISRNPSSDESALEYRIRMPQLVRPGPRFFQDLCPSSSKLECTEQSNVHDNKKMIGKKSFCQVLMLPCGLWKHLFPDHYPDSLACQSKLSSKERIFFVLRGVHFHRLLHMKYPNTWDFPTNRNMPTKHPN